MLTRRRATRDDVPRLVEMGRGYMASIVTPIQFNAAGFEDRLTEWLEAEHVLVQVLDDDGNPVGMIAGYYAGHFLFGAPRMAAELFWWVEPGYRGGPDSVGLMKDYEDWAAKNDCELVTVSAFADDERLPVLLKRRGFAHYESTFVLVG